MDDVWGLFLRMSHGTTPAAVTTNENIIMSSFKSSRNIQKKEGGPDKLFRIYESKPIMFSDFSEYFCRSQRIKSKI